MAKLPPLNANMPVVDPKTGRMTPEFERFLEVILREMNLREDVITGILAQLP